MITIGYDMSAVLPMNETAQKNYDQASETLTTARAALDALPEDERGELDQDRMVAEDLTFRDHRAWTDRSERYMAAADALEAARTAADRADLNYFRLNIFGMSRYMHAMAILGMVQEGGKSPYEWPESDGIGDDADWDAIYDLQSERLKDLAQGDPAPSEGAVVSKVISDYVDAVLAKLLWVPQPVTGIYGNKFSSNDGWAVTPQEIRTALATYHTKTEQQVTAALNAAGINNSDGYWDAWIGFLTHCETHGGFTVH
jgi:hypothetical protein